MKNYLYLGLSLITLAGCKKIDLESMRPNNSMFGGQCLNTKDETPEKSSPYRHLKFSDSFDPNQTGACYTKKPKCGTRLDWFAAGDCEFDEKNPRYTGLKDLNKCIWQPWQGYNYWATNKQMTYTAEGVEVKNGKLILKVMPNPDYDPSKGYCGDTDPAHEWDNQYFNRNCKFISGAVFSKYHNAEYHGYNAMYGRIEMKARFTQTTPNAAYPALWMWPDAIGKGYPNTATGADLITRPGGDQEPRQIGEIDILESDGGTSMDYAFQSYHQWEFKDKIHAYWTKGRTAKMSEWHTYGVEWAPSYIKFYIDGCYTYQIKKGDKSTHGNFGIPMTISDTASFMMMTIGASNHPLDPHNGDTFEIDEVRVYD